MAKPFNVLFITADQFRRDHMGCAGNPVIRTPHLDRLAAEGTMLDRAYVCNPVCMPNRSSIVTGRLPRNHGCWCNGVDLPDCEKTIADALNAHGYHTALLGKAHFRHSSTPFNGVPRGLESGRAWEQGLNSPDWTGPYYGFQHVELSVGHGHANLNRAHHCEWVKKNHPGALDNQFKSIPSPTGAMECFTPLYPYQAHSSSWLGEIGSNYLRDRARDEKPFFMWASFPDPHHPFAVPSPYDTMYDPAQVVMPRIGQEFSRDKPPHFRDRLEKPNRDGSRLVDMREDQLREMISRTYGMITLIDENIGRMLAALDQTGLAENTIVIFTSDHGDLMGDCGLVLKGPWLLEGLINVPMLWRIPGSGGRCRASGLFNSCDIAPTVLELLGIEVPLAMDGIPQEELVRGGHARRDAAFVEYRTPSGDNVRCIITPERKLTYYAGASHGELYDMTADEPEAVNLYASPQHAAECAELKTRLLDELILRDDRRLQPTAGS